MEGGRYLGVAAVVEPSMGVVMGDDVIGTEHSPLLEQQEEEEFKVRSQGHDLMGDSLFLYYIILVISIKKAVHKGPFWNKKIVYSA